MSVIDDTTDPAYADFEAAVTKLLSDGANPDDLIDTIRKVAAYLEQLEEPS